MHWCALSIVFVCVHCVCVCIVYVYAYAPVSIMCMCEHVCMQSQLWCWDYREQPLWQWGESLPTGFLSPKAGGKRERWQMVCWGA